MNEQNFDFLSRQIMYTGFGEEHARDLKAKMAAGEPEFVLTHKQNFGNDETAATLQFRKGDSADFYFFNRYALMLKSGENDPVKQTFFVNPKQDNITLKEAYNLLSGRAVEKMYASKEGEKYKAWLQMDFKDMDPNGQYKLRQFHPNYGFDLEASLTKHPIHELKTNEGTRRLLEALQRGNRQAVTYGFNNHEGKLFVEAAPQFKTLTFYDENQKRINFQMLNKVGDSQTAGKEENKTHSISEKPKRIEKDKSVEAPKVSKSNKKSPKL